MSRQEAVDIVKQTALDCGVPLSNSSVSTVIKKVKQYCFNCNNVAVWVGITTNKYVCENHVELLFDEKVSILYDTDRFFINGCS